MFRLSLRHLVSSQVVVPFGNCKRQTHLFSLEIKDMNNIIVTLEAYEVDEISKDKYSTAPEREFFSQELEFQEQKAVPIGLLLGLKVVQRQRRPVKREENFVLFVNSIGRLIAVPVFISYHKKRLKNIAPCKLFLHLTISTSR